MELTVPDDTRKVVHLPVPHRIAGSEEGTGVMKRERMLVLFWDGWFWHTRLRKVQMYARASARACERVSERERETQYASIVWM